MMASDWLVNLGLLMNCLATIILGFFVKFIVLPGENLRRLATKWDTVVVASNVGITIPSHTPLVPEEEKKQPKNPILYGFAWFLMGYGYYLQISGNLLKEYLHI